MTRVGSYEIRRRLATGSMAEVFLAVQRGPEGFEREVVLKRLRPEHASDGERRAMFLDEARLLASLRHPHIAQVFELIEHEEGPYLAMELVPGVTLAEVLAAARARRQPIHPSEALAICLGVAEALAHLHARRDDLGEPLGAVHRDVTPSNVVIGEQGEVKLIDFGIAKASSKVHVTRTGVVMGTLGYMPPEQLRGEPVDERADVYALGVLLYESSTGVHPFGKGNEADVEARVLGGQLAPPSSHGVALPADVEALIVQCLQLRPSDRPSTAREVAQRIGRALLADGTWPGMSRLAGLVQETREGHSRAEARAARPASPRALAPGTSGAERPARRLAWWSAAAIAATAAAYALGRVVAQLLWR